ncbi:group II intron maturase-specific domain-containing protein, partial [Aeromonas caviae]
MSDEPSCSNVLDPQLPRCAWLLACSVSRKDASPQSSASARRIPVRILSGNGVHRFRNHCSTSPEYAKTSESKFLGFTFKTGKILIHPKTLQRFKQQVRRLTNRNWGVAMEYQLFKTSQYLRGWIHYFGIANCYQLCVELDQWIRRRIRMAYWRQWRKPRTKVRNLMMHIPVENEHLFRFKMNADSGLRVHRF